MQSHERACPPGDKVLVVLLCASAEICGGVKAVQQGDDVGFLGLPASCQRLLLPALQVLLEGGQSCQLLLSKLSRIHNLDSHGLPLPLALVLACWV